MPTFNDLQSRLANAKFRKAILTHLIEYVDATFMPVAGADPKQRLLTEDKVPVPTDVFESVLADTLSAEVQQLDQEISSVLQAALEDAPRRQRRQASPQGEGA